MTTIRLTMAQALVRFLAAQRSELDGRESPLFAGVFAIFGHGNVAGRGNSASEIAEVLEDAGEVFAVRFDRQRRAVPLDLEVLQESGDGGLHAAASGGPARDDVRQFLGTAVARPTVTRAAPGRAFLVLRQRRD